MFTLRVVFYGLIAFVPNNKDQGLTALLVDAHSVGAAHHTPQVWLVQGECSVGDCLSVDANPKRKQPSEVEILLKKRRAFPLLWTLNKSDLRISLSPAPNTQGLGLPLTFTLPQFPSSSADAASVKWIPRMAGIDSGVGDILRDCLLAAQDCPISGRFRLHEGGTAKSCHFLHDEEGFVHGFFFAPKGVSSKPDQGHALADALEVDFTIDGSSVDLLSRYFVDYAKPSPTIRLSATLKPVGGYVTLVVTNQPTEANQDLPLHFLSYYKLTESSLSGIKTRDVPNLVPKLSKRMYVGDCESVLDALEDLAKGIERFPFYVPHNRPECDMVQFRMSPLG